MTDTKHPEALRLVEQYDYGDPVAHSNTWKTAVCNELRRLHAENATLQAGYDAARLEIDHLRGVTKSMLLAQPVAWMVYLPSIDTQNVYDSQDDPGYVDDVTNHADAEVTPLYEMAATKAEVAPAGEYPPLPEPLEIDWPELHSQALGCGVEDRGLRDRYECAEYGWQDGVDKAVECVPDELYDADQMRTYADATCAMRAQAAPAAVASPLTKLQRKAIAVCFTSDKVSVSEVQRKLSISYADAQTLCQSIVDLGLTDELELAPSLKRCAPASQPAPVAHGGAQQRAMDARHAAIYRWIIQHIDKAASIIDAWREDGEADKDELHDALAARAANA